MPFVLSWPSVDCSAKSPLPSTNMSRTVASRPPCSAYGRPAARCTIHQSIAVPLDVEALAAADAWMSVGEHKRSFFGAAAELAHRQVCDGLSLGLGRVQLLDRVRDRAARVAAGRGRHQFRGVGLRVEPPCFDLAVSN